MPKFCRRLALLLSLFLPAAKGADDPARKLKAILAAYDKRDEESDSTKAHQLWITTDAGRVESAYLAEHYDQLHDTRKYDVPMELAKTGKPEALPLIRKALADPTHGFRVLSGILHACRVGDATEAFRREL